MKDSVLLLLVLLFVSCSYDDEENRCNYQPSDCNEIESPYGYVTVECNHNRLNPRVPIVLFKESEQGSVILQDTLTTGSKRYYVRNGNIAARAQYKKIIKGDTATVFVLKERRLSADKENYCEGPCYEEGDISFELYLKL